MIEQALNMVKRFLKNEYPPLEFSYDFPDFLIEHYNEMEAENKKINDILNDNMPEICAEYEQGANATAFIQKVKAELSDILKRWYNA